MEGPCARMAPPLRLSPAFTEFRGPLHDARHASHTPASRLGHASLVALRRSPPTLAPSSPPPDTGNTSTELPAANDNATGPAVLFHETPRLVPQDTTSQPTFTFEQTSKP